MAFSTTYYIKKGAMDYNKFIAALNGVQSAKSVTGINYISIKLEGEKIVGIRESTGAPFSIDAKQLYSAYTNVKVFTTAELKPYVDRVQSPSLAILIAMQAIEPASEDEAAKIKEKKTTEKKVAAEPKLEMNKNLKKFLFAFLTVGILIIVGIYGKEDPVQNGRLTNAAHEQAEIAIKSQIQNPLSYEGGNWESTIWDSSSSSKHYVMKQAFTMTNDWGERVRCIAFIYFDVNGKPTDIEIIQ